MKMYADISSPNYETRMAILQKKIELDHLEKYNIPNDVLEYIATNVKTNIRELEGSLNKLIALYKLNHNGPIDIALASEALKDIISADNKREIKKIPRRRSGNHRCLIMWMPRIISMRQQ